MSYERTTIFTDRHQMASCLAASAIHQIGGTLESESMLPGNTLLRDLTDKMRKCADDIIETVYSDPWMFYVLINSAVSSGVLKIIDMRENHEEESWRIMSRHSPRSPW